MCTRGRFSVMIKSPDKLINKGDYTPLKNSSDLYITLSGENELAIEHMQNNLSLKLKKVLIFIFVQMKSKCKYSKQMTAIKFQLNGQLSWTLFVKHQKKAKQICSSREVKVHLQLTKAESSLIPQTMKVNLNLVLDLS